MSRIDILKMDIEGAEYDVIDDIINSPVPIAQVLIEFHHRFPNHRDRKDPRWPLHDSMKQATGFLMFLLQARKFHLSRSAHKMKILLIAKHPMDRRGSHCLPRG